MSGTLLSRKEQLYLINQFEREYGKLLIQANKGECSCLAYKKKCKSLNNDMQDIAKRGVFEDDTLELLKELSHTICSTVNPKFLNTEQCQSAA